MSEGPRPSDALAVCVLGMTRSGTSLTARILNLLGVYLGAEEALSHPRNERNPKGFWEHDQLRALNQRILRHFGGEIHEPPAMPPGWEEAEALAPVREQAEAVLRERFQGRALWGWKDPRNSLTLPIWQRLVSGLRYVVCVRNPLDVAASIENRGGLPPSKSFEIWLRYVSAAIVHTAGAERLFVFFEDYFDDWRAQVAALARLAGVPERAEDEPVQAAVADWIEHDLRHHGSGLLEAVEDVTLPLEVKSLYLLLRLAAPRAGTARDAVSLEAERALDAYARFLFERDLRTRAVTVSNRRA